MFNKCLSSKIIELWLVLYIREISAEYSDSSNSFSLKPIESVVIGLFETSDICETIALESIPPLRKAPMGTSLSMRDFTASFNSSLIDEIGEACSFTSFRNLKGSQYDLISIFPS